MTALVDEHPRLGVECVLRELSSASSTYYRWRRAEREPCERRRRDVELTEQRFRRASLLDEYLARLLADVGISPPTVARASKISTAVRLAAQGLGVTVVPASAVPESFEQLACPFLPCLTEPVIIGIRRHPGSAEAAVLDHLHQQNWCGTSLLAPPAYSPLS
ncbi:LysR substrate-binding domain-containing protein [Streptomyces umbrinus]|uniref:LysR substrate-binding domain-containing protein n=1 Tax=Streptomyces umbrinus TaxID=67370 RepID=UPI003C2CD8E7